MNPSTATHLPPLDPDPLTVVNAAGEWADGFDIGYGAGYDKGLADSLPRIGAVLAMFVIGIAVGVALARALGLAA